MTAARNIDYWGIVTRSARMVWDHKFLWFFGFFAGSGGGGGGNYGNIGEHGVDEIKSFFLSHAGVMVAIIMGLVLLWLVLLVMSLISKGALLSCISRADAGETIRFETGWRAGLKACWGMLGIAFIALLAFLVVTTVCVLAVVLPLIGGAAGIAIAVHVDYSLILSLSREMDSASGRHVRPSSHDSEVISTRISPRIPVSIQSFNPIGFAAASTHRCARHAGVTGTLLGVAGGPSGMSRPVLERTLPRAR